MQLGAACTSRLQEGEATALASWRPLSRASPSMRASFPVTAKARQCTFSLCRSGSGCYAVSQAPEGDGAFKPVPRGAAAAARAPTGLAGALGLHRLTLTKRLDNGGVAVEVGSEVDSPSYAMQIAKLLAKQEHVIRVEAKMKTVIQHVAKTTGALPEDFVQKASKGVFTHLRADDFRRLVETLLPEPSRKALGDLRWENSTDVPRLKQLMIDAVLQWASDQQEYAKAFSELDEPREKLAMHTSVISYERSLDGNQISCTLKLEAEGPSIPVLRDKAADRSFLADLTPWGDPYGDAQEHEIRARSVGTIFRLAKLPRMDSFRFCLSAGSVAQAGSPLRRQEGRGDAEGGPPEVHCSGGVELYQNLAMAISEYLENFAEDPNNRERWVPSEAAISFARVGGGGGGRVHAVRIDHGFPGRPGEDETVVLLNETELGRVAEAVDITIQQHPELLQLTAPSPKSPSREWPAAAIARAAAVLGLAAASAWLLARSFAAGVLDGGSADGARRLPPAAASPAEPARRVITPANDEVPGPAMEGLCRSVEEQLKSRALPVARAGWARLGDFVLEYQVVVSREGAVLGCRPANGFGVHFFRALDLLNFKTPWREIDREERPVVLKASIANRVVDGEADPEVSVRGWTDDDSLMLWGMRPPDRRAEPPPPEGEERPHGG